MKAGIAVGFASRFSAAALAALAGLGLVGKPAAAAEWKPERPVEIVALNAPGGGSDRIARIFIKILQELDLNFWNSAYKGSLETRKYLAQDNEGVKAFLAELGLAR